MSKTLNLKKTIFLLLRIILVLTAKSACGTVLRVISGIIRGEHGAPSFVTPAFTVYGIIMNLLLITAFLIFDSSIPVKNRFLRSFLFVFFFWSADYLSQILGMTGAVSPLLSKKAFSFSTILTDSLEYAFGALMFGLLLAKKRGTDFSVQKKSMSKGWWKASLLSMLIFPVTLILLEIILYLIHSDFVCCNSFAIAKEDTARFYLVFYLFQAFSGFLFPLFYRFTEYNSNHKHKWLVFANVQGFMLWTPVVAIMPFFGVDVAPTVAFAVIMLVAIYFDTWLFCKVFDK